MREKHSKEYFEDGITEKVSEYDSGYRAAIQDVIKKMEESEDGDWDFLLFTLKRMQT